MEISVLGPLAVQQGTIRREITSRKLNILLALLATDPNRVVSLDRIADELWSGEPPSESANAIQVGISRLRKALGDDRHTIVATHSTGYLLRADETALDSLRFEADIRAAEAVKESRARRSLLAQALLLWRGAAFEGITTPAIRSVAVRLDEMRLMAIELRIDADLESGRAGELVGELEELVQRHPWRERFWAQSMLALYRSGRQAAALSAAARLRVLLQDELGVDPAPEVRRLEQAILRQDPVLDAGMQARPRATLRRARLDPRPPRRIGEHVGCRHQPLDPDRHG